MSDDIDVTELEARAAELREQVAECEARKRELRAEFEQSERARKDAYISLVSLQHQIRDIRNAPYKAQIREIAGMKPR